MTPAQLRILHIARRQLELEDQQYRFLLRNVAGVDSSKDLDHQSMEDVMATLEESGFRHQGKHDTYWRDKVRQRHGGEATQNQVWMIDAMCQQLGLDPRGFAHRMSRHRTDRPERLYAREAYNVIEALKAIEGRKSLTAEDAERGTGAPPVVCDPHYEDDEVPF